MNIKIVDMTPAMAAQILQMNTANFRRIDNARVNRYADVMRKGYWQENGEPIQIYEDGVLANGQHRLSAVVASGVTLKNVVVISGISRKVSLYDRGSNRSATQTARAMGVNLTSNEAGACGLMITGLKNLSKYDDGEMIYFHSKMKDFDIVAYAMRKGSNHPLCTKSGALAAAYCAYVLKKVTLNQIEEFAQIANSGLPKEGINSYPALCIRKTYQMGFVTKNGERAHNGYTARIAQFETMYKALCDFGKGVKRMKVYVPDGLGDAVIQTARKTLGL